MRRQGLFTFLGCFLPGGSIQRTSKNKENQLGELVTSESYSPKLTSTRVMDFYNNSMDFHYNGLDLYHNS